MTETIGISSFRDMKSMVKWLGGSGCGSGRAKIRVAVHFFHDSCDKNMCCIAPCIVRDLPRGQPVAHSWPRRMNP